MSTIGACLIVRNEAAIIRDCLASVWPLGDYVLVVDTGSTDGTQQVVREFLREFDIPGAVVEETWRDFAYNRTDALARLRVVEGIDYALVIDADDLLELNPGFDPAGFKARLTHDIYDIEVRHHSIVHHRPQLFSNRLPFTYKGVVHEYLEPPPGNFSRGTAGGIAIRASTNGMRSRNPNKYRDDAALLEKSLAAEKDPFLISRYTFYLAQSWKDCAEHQKAIACYLRRSRMGFWDEERYVSLVEAGNLMAVRGCPFDEVIETYQRAIEINPNRAEAMHAASRYCRMCHVFVDGMDFARRGMDLVQPGGLFIQPWVYDWGIRDEFAINAYWAGAYLESLDASLDLLAGGKLPWSMTKRVAENARFAAGKIRTLLPG